MGKEWTAGKPREPKEKTIMEQINAIVDDICDNYCKYPDVCMSEKKDPDEAEDMLYQEYCVKCPMRLL